MNTPVEFFDAFQSRINEIYAAKFRLDEAAKRGNTRASEGDLDKQSLYLELAAAHEHVRNINFEAIQSRRWQEEVATKEANPLLAIFYNLFTRVSLSSSVDLSEYCAKHIVRDFTKPLVRYSTQEYPDGYFQMTSVTKEAEIDNLVKVVQGILKIRPYLIFLHCLSTCETFLPLGKENANSK